SSSQNNTTMLVDEEETHHSLTESNQSANILNNIIMNLL
ncbi:hypothetical protein KPH14_000734, partial [Odynerus spinipes]